MLLQAQYFAQRKTERKLSSTIRVMIGYLIVALLVVSGHYEPPWQSVYAARFEDGKLFYEGTWYVHLYQ